MVVPASSSMSLGIGLGAWLLRFNAWGQTCLHSQNQRNPTQNFQPVSAGSPRKSLGGAPSKSTFSVAAESLTFSILRSFGARFFPVVCTSDSVNASAPKWEYQTASICLSVCVCTYLRTICNVKLNKMVPQRKHRCRHAVCDLPRTLTFQIFAASVTAESAAPWQPKQ